MSKNIEINYNDGTQYEVLYPTVNLANVTGTLPLDSTSGTLALSRGGTGATTGPKALGNLIKDTNMLAYGGLASDDNIAVYDYSADIGKSILVEDFMEYINRNANIYVDYYSYTGTGTYSTGNNLYFNAHGTGYYPVVILISWDDIKAPLTNYPLSNVLILDIDTLDYIYSEFYNDGDGTVMGSEASYKTTYIRFDDGYCYSGFNYYVTLLWAKVS